MKLKCPNCGNEPGNEDMETIDYVDWTPSHRPISSSKGKVVHVDWENLKDYPEAAKDPEFCCNECDTSWSTDGFRIE